MQQQPEHLRRVQRLIREHPWAMRPEALDILLEIVDRRVSGVRFSDSQIEAAIEGARAAAPQRVSAPGSIAVLALHGIISHRIHMVQDISGPGGTSTEGFGKMLRAALDDAAVSAIVIDVDSPGGSVFGVEELSDQIYRARETKPIVAVANAMAASAAYYLASQAEEVVVTPSGEVGSIGVLAVHDDFSGYLENAGVKRTYVTAGRFKAEGNETEPLADEARGYLQQRVDEYYDDFVRAVGRGRKVSVAKVRSDFGEGRMVGAARAVELGMADREGTLEETIARLQKRHSKTSGARSETPAEDGKATRLRLQLAAAARRD